MGLDDSIATPTHPPHRTPHGPQESPADRDPVCPDRPP